MKLNVSKIYLLITFFLFMRSVDNTLNQVVTF